LPIRESPAQPAPPPKDGAPPYPTEKARGGEIILRSRARRAVFIAGLVGAVAFLLLVVMLNATHGL
jgi:hypothetical protein